MSSKSVLKEHWKLNFVQVLTTMSLISTIDVPTMLRMLRDSQKDSVVEIKEVSDQISVLEAALPLWELSQKMVKENKNG